MNILDVLTIMPILADGADSVISVIVALITIVVWIANLVSNKNQKGPPVANRPRPPVRPRDERLQQEINIFIEDNAGPRSKAASPKAATTKTPPSRPVVPASRPVSQRSKAPRRPPTPTPRPATATSKPGRRPRAGNESEIRTSPVTEPLASSVKQHLSQQMSDRGANDAQQRMVPRVEVKAADVLGVQSTTSSTTRVAGAPSLPHDSAARLSEMLRKPASVRQAMILSVILSPPPVRTRSSGH